MGAVTVSQSYCHLGRVSRWEGLFGATALHEHASQRWIIEAGHFTVPYPFPTRHMQSEWVFGTVSIMSVLAEHLYEVGSSVERVMLLGDLAYPPTERPALRTRELPLDLSDMTPILESTARSKGKRAFNSWRHRVLSVDAAAELLTLSGGLLFSVDGSDGVYFSATPAYRAFNEVPGYAHVATRGAAVPLCPVVIAGKYLLMLAHNPDGCIAIYDRREDINIRAKNFWGACMAMVMLAQTVTPCLSTVLNISVVDDDVAWVDRIRFEPSAPTETVDDFLGELSATHSGLACAPYVRPRGNA